MKIGFSEEELVSRNKYLPFDGRSIVRFTKLSYRESKAGNQVAVMEFTGVGPNAGQTGKEEAACTAGAKWRFAELFEAAGFSKEQMLGGLEIEDAVGKVLALERKATGKRKSATNGKEYTEYEYHFRKPMAEEVKDIPGEESESVPNFEQDDVTL